MELLFCYSSETLSFLLNFSLKLDLFFWCLTLIACCSFNCFYFILSLRYSSIITLPFFISFLFVRDDLGSSTISHLSIGKNCFDIKWRASRLVFLLWAHCSFILFVELLGVVCSPSFMLLVPKGVLLRANIFSPGFILLEAMLWTVIAWCEDPCELLIVGFAGFFASTISWTNCS